MHSRILSSETEKQITDNIYKFVRDGEKVAFDEALGSQHWTIAKENNLGSEISLGAEKRLVDDAGVLDRHPSGRLRLSDYSITCKLTNEACTARLATRDAVQKLLSCEVVVE